MLSGKKNLNSAFSLAPVLQLIKNPDTVLRIERIAHDCKIAQHDIYIYVLFFFFPKIELISEQTVDCLAS